MADLMSGAGKEGLLSGVLPWAFSQGDRLKRNVQRFIASPTDALNNALAVTEDQTRAVNRDAAEAFGGEKLNLNSGAAARVLDGILGGPLAFAPVASLFPGDKSEIIATHSTSPGSLLISPTDPYTASASKPVLRNELYNPSFALTKDRVDANFGSLLLVPNPIKIDPKTSPSTVKATDFYSPRYKDSYAGGGFDMAERLKNDYTYSKASDALVEDRRVIRYLAEKDPQAYPIVKDEYIKRIAQALADKKAAYEKLKPSDADVTRRMNDRFGSGFPKGGALSEGRYPGDNNPRDINTFHRLRMDLSPRFQSLEHYVDSPYGGKLLTKDIQAPIQSVAKMDDAWRKTLDEVSLTGAPRDTYGELHSMGSFMDPGGEDAINWLKKIAGGEFPKNGLTTRQGVPLDQQALKNLQERAQTILEGVKTAPSDYGEIKRFGPMGINQSNFAGAIDLDPASNPNWRDLKVGFASRGIPYIPMNLDNFSPDAIRQTIEAIQTEALLRGR